MRRGFLNVAIAYGFIMALSAANGQTSNAGVEDIFEARAGDLHVVQMWSDDEDRFMREWAQPTPPNLTVSTETVRNKPITQFILFGGCTSDTAGNCYLTANVEMTDPNGERYGEVFNFAVWDNLPAPQPNVFILSPNGVGLVIEDGEQLGIYRVRLAVTDEHAAVTAVTQVSLVVTESGEAAE